MTGGGPRPPKLTRFINRSYEAMVRKADPDFTRNANYVIEYDFSALGRGIKDRYGWYKTRGAYDGTYPPDL